MCRLLNKRNKNNKTELNRKVNTEFTVMLQCVYMLAIAG